MRKGRDGRKKMGREETGGKKKRMMKIVATTSFPAVDRPNAGKPHTRANFCTCPIPEL